MARAVVGRMPLWAGESQDIETAMLMDSGIEGAEYRQVEGHDPKGLKNNPDGAE